MPAGRPDSVNVVTQLVELEKFMFTVPAAGATPETGEGVYTVVHPDEEFCVI